MLYRKLTKSVGQPLSFNRATNIIKNTGTKISTDTVIKYLENAKDAYLVYGLSNYAAAIADKESILKYYIVDNGIMSLMGNGLNVSLFENIVAMSLIRRYGTDGSLYYYKNGIEVDFYLPDEGVAIQACYNFNDSEETMQREIGALLKLNKRFSCRKNIIVTIDTNQTFNIDGVSIEAISLTRFLLDK